MKIIPTCVLFFLAMFSFSQNPVTSDSDWLVTNITPDNTLDYPNTVLYRPDDDFWIAEREGKQVVKIDKNTGAKSVLLDLTAEVHQSKGQDRLMGMAIYEEGFIPYWGQSLLIPTLKRGTIYRVKLNAAGNAIDGNPALLDDSVYEEFHSSNDRYRDVAVDPDGITFYAITGNTGSTSGPSGTSKFSIENPGVVIKIQFTGQTLSSVSQDLTDIGIYPNPTKDTFHLKSNGFDNVGDLNVAIVDMQGRLAKSTTLNNLGDQMDISKLGERIYTVSLLSSKQPLINKLKLIVKK